jgi:nucleotide-binding universal stress UspA family protein
MAAAALAAHVDSHGVDLIVMTTHGRGGMSRFWLGSVADQLLRRTTVPVLLLRPSKPVPVPQFHSVLIALDASAQSEEAIAPALALARTTPGSRVVLAHVMGPPLSLVEPALGPEESREAVARLEHLAHRLGLQGIQTTVQLATGARVAEQIHELASAEQADLIVVGTHGRRGVERLLLGSVADKVVRGTDQPVLVVPCGPKRVRRHEAATRVGAVLESGIS